MIALLTITGSAGISNSSMVRTTLLSSSCVGRGPRKSSVRIELPEALKEGGAYSGDVGSDISSIASGREDGLESDGFVELGSVAVSNISGV